jgi:hypothetical protein
MKVALKGTAHGPTHLTLPFLGLDSIRATNSLFSLSKTIVPLPFGSGMRFYPLTYITRKIENSGGFPIEQWHPLI